MIDDDNEFDRMADGTVDGFARNVHTRTIDGVIRAIRSRFLITGMIRDDVPYREYYNDGQVNTDSEIAFDDEATLTTFPITQ